MPNTGAPFLWTAFIAIISVIFLLDTYFIKKSTEKLFKSALKSSLLWVLSALLFNIFLWQYLLHYDPLQAKQKSLEFFTGFIVEKSLSVDNLFVIMSIFQFFAVKAEHEARVLRYGVIGAIVLRFIFIFFGTYLIHKAHWILYVFGAFLIFTGYKILFAKEHRDLAQNPTLIFLKKHIRLTDEFHGQNFFVKLQNKWHATPLFIVVLLVELNDLIFALDSIPAIFAITQDYFIIFTSNVFAILGLRALYFLLAHLANQFTLLKYAVGLILVLMGIKMSIAHWVKVPIVISLTSIIGIIIITILVSLCMHKYRVKKNELP